MFRESCLDSPSSKESGKIAFFVFVFPLFFCFATFQTARKYYLMLFFWFPKILWISGLYVFLSIWLGYVESHLIFQDFWYSGQTVAVKVPVEAQQNF